jgi:hypothetical protein
MRARSGVEPGWTPLSAWSLVHRKQLISGNRSSRKQTQDSLLVAGQALPDGIGYRRVPTKGFQVASYISSSFPKLCLAQGESAVALVAGGQEDDVTGNVNVPFSAPFLLPFVLPFSLFRIMVCWQYGVSFFFCRNVAGAFAIFFTHPINP